MIFPRYLSQDDIKKIKHNPVLSAREYSRAKLVRAADSSAAPRKAQFEDDSEHPVRIFQSDHLINMELGKCALIETNLTDVDVSKKITMETPLKDIVLQIIEAIDGEYDSYINEMAPYFNFQIRIQYAFDVCDKHWFRMAGSSVWLQDYGVHMMVSRLAYSPDGSRNNPKLSFVYTELFDALWQPVKLSLVVPTNGGHTRKSFQHKEKNFTVVNYPAILPVPFHHIYDDESKYLGPEDARVILVKNANGFEEPMLVYNCVHQKLEFVDDDEDYILKQMKRYRSMWVSWPWQYQEGKGKIDGIVNQRFVNNWYNRVKELLIKNVPRDKNQKNWTPMISESLRSTHGYDREILFVFRWANLLILKCDLYSDARCGFVHRMNDRLVTSSRVGPFRGGTQLININELLRQNEGEKMVEQMIPHGREIWVGFARAHLYMCGCGRDLYRPNLVVMVKDTVGSKGLEQKEIFKLSHVSSFLSLNVDIIPWNALRPYQLCKGTNALIPNGISKWNVKVRKNNEGIYEVDDEVILSISVSDSTIDLIHMRGLLKALLNDPQSSLFVTSNKDGEVQNTPRIPQSMNDDLATYGFNNDNLVCAMQAAEQFCMEYGREKIAIQKEKEGDLDTTLDAEIYDIKMERYRWALEELGLDF